MTHVVIPPNPPPRTRTEPAVSDLNDLAVASEEGGRTGGAAGGGALDSAMVEKKEVRRGGRLLLLLREVLKRLGYCCTRPPVEVYRGKFGAKIRFSPQICPKY
mgnify:CR=1 FL=1